MLRAWTVLWTLALGKSLTPRVKWGQNKDQLFLSVIVRDLDPASVSVEVTRDELRFHAKSREGEENVLQMPFREDVRQDSLKWEIAARPDKWGTATLLTLGKGHGHRWDVLSEKSFKGVIEKDWTREDPNLEADEISIFEDAEHVLRLTEKNFNQTVQSHGTLVVAARFPWCRECKQADQSFLKAAAAAKVMSRKKKDWKKVGFGFLDARENKLLGRRYEAGCDITVAKNCDYLVFSGSEEPVRMANQYDEAKLIGELKKFLSPAVREASLADIEHLKASNITAIGYFASKDQKEYASFLGVANQMRGELVFAVSFGESRDHVELWVDSELLTLPLRDFQANRSVLETWLRRRSLPLLQDYEWSKRDVYERLKLPVAKVWYDEADDSAHAKVNSTVMAVARRMLGRMAFVKQKKSMYSYELRDYGLNSEELPAFGIAENVSWNSKKFGLETSKDFWDQGESKLLEFCEAVLAGTVEESHESGPLHSNWSKGEVKRIVWKSFHEVKTPQTNLLLEIYGKYRAENHVKLKEAENLARVLEAVDVTVAGYDTAENYLPPEQFPRDKYASHAEWYWIPVGGVPTMMRKPKKDPAMKKVLQFLASQAPDLKLPPEILEKWELAMKENPPSEPKDTGFDDDVMRDMAPEPPLELPGKKTEL